MPMDPPQTGNETSCHRSFNSDPLDADDVRLLDPPSHSYLNRENKGRHVIWMDSDHQLDENELEGLMMTPRSNSFISSGRPKSNRGSLLQLSTPISIACSLAWTPRNRTRSFLIVLILAWMLMFVFMKRQISPQHQKHNKGQNSQVHDSLAGLTPEQRRTLLSSIYGSWSFYDGSADKRPTEPYVTVEKAGTYLDLKGEAFPQNSWQVDAVYVNHFLDAAIKLVKRGQDAIFSTYHGHGIVNVSVQEGQVAGVLEHPEERMNQRLTMFHLEEVDLKSINERESLLLKSPLWKTQGGWTTTRSMDGLKRRLLHAMMTNSKFTILLTGSWQSMGYGGNHGWQSMAGVLEYLLSGLFEKMGVNLVVRGIGLPPMDNITDKKQNDSFVKGKSTLVHALGWSSIYGSDVDMVVWDDYSGENELGKYTPELDATATEIFDLFARQALLSGSVTLPFIWGGDFAVLRTLHEQADADVGQLGNGMSGIPETIDENMVSSVPWAAQYLNCTNEKRNWCNREDLNFASKCWIQSSELHPPQPQLDHIPIIATADGWRIHQLKAYTLAYNVLSALLDALNTWSERTIYEGHPLADEYWHIGEYITNIQGKVQSLNEQNAPHCYQLIENLHLPKRLCNHRMKGRTEYTPRANPSETSLSRIIVPSTKEPLINSDMQIIFQGILLENPVDTIPDHAVDALEILELGNQERRRMKFIELHRQKQHSNDSVSFQSNREHQIVKNKRKLEVTKSNVGWQFRHSFLGDDCNGSLFRSSSCGRVSSSTCLMEGHQGSRGGIWGDQSTGWISMIVPGVEFGYVAINLEIGAHDEQDTPLQKRIPESFMFEYSIEDAVRILNKLQFMEKFKQINGIGLLTIMDDENTNESQDIKLSFRVHGRSQEKLAVAVTHIYWC